MSLRINTNVEAFNAHRNLTMSSSGISKSMEKLSSGLRINRAADDAAGLAISEKMRAQIKGLAQAQRNAQDGISMVQTAEGALQEFHSILGRVRDLAVQYNNGIYDDASKAAITAEVVQLSAEMDRLIASTTFNGINLLSGTGILATLQIGANGGETIAINALDVATSVADAVEAFATAAASGVINITDLQTAIDNISSNRASLGAVQNRLEHAVNFLGVYQENLAASESRIRDVDMASEMTQFTRLQILQQSGTAMLAQANQGSQGVLSLLRV